VVEEISGWLAPILAVVAVLYASVGHGGASGYLAVMALAEVPKEVATSTALAMNLIVATTAFIAFRQRNFFHARLALPFVAAGIPMAFLGGIFRLGDRAYMLILGVALALAAIRMFLPALKIRESGASAPHLGLALALGGVIGLVSGMVGIGGGVFLSPLILMMGWAGPKETAATSAIFIVVNSAAGMLGRHFGGQLAIDSGWPLLVAGMAGGLIGAYLGSRTLAPASLRYALGLVLCIAALKSFIS
jgi:uncharacterized protein